MKDKLLYNERIKNPIDTKIGGCRESHGYLSRGRFDKGNYSIEYSNSYKGFAKGLYIVMISSGGAQEEQKVLLSKAKEFYKDEYSKKAQCILVVCIDVKKMANSAILLQKKCRRRPKKGKYT